MRYRFNWRGREYRVSRRSSSYEVHPARIVISANVIMLLVPACLYLRAFIFHDGSSFHHACFLLPSTMLRSCGRCCSQFSSVTPTPCGVLLRARNERTSRSTVAEASPVLCTHFAYHRAVRANSHRHGCLSWLGRVAGKSLTENLSARWPSLSLSFFCPPPPPPSPLSLSLRATIHTSSVCFCSVYLGALQHLSTSTLCCARKLRKEVYL